MLDAYIPILILGAISILQAVGMVVGSHFLGPIRPTPAKRSAYESGMVPLGNARERFSVKFYMVAILFIVFDLETIFLIPWGVTFRQLGLFGFVEMLIFIAILVVGFVYVWKKGALQWE